MQMSAIPVIALVAAGAYVYYARKKQSRVQKEPLSEYNYDYHVIEYGPNIGKPTPYANTITSTNPNINPVIVGHTFGGANYQQQYYLGADGKYHPVTQTSTMSVLLQGQGLFVEEPEPVETTPSVLITATEEPPPGYQGGGTVINNSTYGTVNTQGTSTAGTLLY